MVSLEKLLGMDSVPELLIPAEVAKGIRVHPSTVRRQCEAGMYAGAFKLPGGKQKADSGDWRIPSGSLKKNLESAETTGEYAA